MTKDNASQNAAQEMTRAQEVLAEDHHLLTGCYYNGVVTRAYYAAFHGARALLITRGLESKTHRSVIQLFNLHFIKDSPFPTQVAKHLSHLETYRELSDYTAHAQFTEEQAKTEIASAKAFIAANRPLIGPSKTP